MNVRTEDNADEALVFLDPGQIGLLAGIAAMAALLLAVTLFAVVECFT